VGIKDKDSIPLSTVDQTDVGQASMQFSDGINTADTGNDELAWSDVVSRKNKRSGTLQQSGLTVVYVDQSLKKRLVSGLESTESKYGTDQFEIYCLRGQHVI
jgi:hypothetical protein